jgi:glucose-6-phosphate isomerase
MLTTMKSKLQQNYSQALELFPNFKGFQSELEAKFEEVKTNLINTSQGSSIMEYYKWLDFDYLESANKKTIDLANSLKKRSDLKNIFVVGMGGSGINSMVLKNSLYEFSCENKAYNFFIQNNLDPISLLARLNEIDETFTETLFVIITKSGGTDEVRRNLQTIMNFAEAKEGFDLKKFAANLVFITEPERDEKANFMHTFRNEIKEKTGSVIPYLENDPNIGGRFSMFSPVGMFSAEMMGLSSQKLIQGAKQAFENFKAGAPAFFDLAALDIFLAQNNFNTRYSMVYADSLEAVNKFRAQLKGESLNKDGIESTIHVPGIGTVNHHSDLELLLKKENGLILEQVFFANARYDHKNKASLDCFKDLDGQSNFDSLRKNHIDPLAQYILENKAPVIQTIIENQDEESLAEFYMQDMILTVVQAGIQDEMGKTEKQDLVIRQWEVERYKKSLKK